MRISRLEPRAHQSPILRPPTVVDFPAYPKSPDGKAYSVPFVTELRRQLGIQQRYLNQLRVDEWFLNLARFRLGPVEYRQIDATARESVLLEYIRQSRTAKQRTARTLAQEQRQMDQALERVTSHQVRDKGVIVMERGQPDRVIDLSYTLVGETTRKLVRAKQRAQASREIQRELSRAHREDENPQLIRARYPGLKEWMELKIGGRTGGERAARAHFEEVLPKLLELTTEWETLATKASELAMTHTGDMVAGGYDRWPLFERPPGDDYNSPEWRKYLARLREFVGASNVNSKIGSDWSRLIKDTIWKVRSQVPNYEQHPLHRMNLRLNVKTSA